MPLVQHTAWTLSHLAWIFVLGISGTQLEASDPSSGSTISAQNSSSIDQSIRAATETYKFGSEQLTLIAERNESGDTLRIAFSKRDIIGPATYDQFILHVYDDKGEEVTAKRPECWGSHFIEVGKPGYHTASGYYNLTLKPERTLSTARLRYNGNEYSFTFKPE
jgi:hypothetical protein